jgi:hypothetical protein
MGFRAFAGRRAKPHLGEAVPLIEAPCEEFPGPARSSRRGPRAVPGPPARPELLGAGHKPGPEFPETRKIAAIGINPGLILGKISREATHENKLQMASRGGEAFSS